MWLCNHYVCKFITSEWLQIYYLEQQITIYWAKLLREEIQQEQMGKIFSTSPKTTQGIQTATVADL